MPFEVTVAGQGTAVAIVTVAERPATSMPAWTGQRWSRPYVLRWHASDPPGTWP